jgi:porin
VTWKGAIPGRKDDTVGIGLTYAKIAPRAQELDRDTAFFTGTAYPIRTAETVLEVTYQAPVTPWLTLQPDFQYIFSPAGGVPNPNNPAKRLGDAAVLGLRGVVVF